MITVSEQEGNVIPFSPRQASSSPQGSKLSRPTKSLVLPMSIDDLAQGGCCRAFRIIVTVNSVEPGHGFNKTGLTYCGLHQALFVFINGCTVQQVDGDRGHNQGYSRQKLSSMSNRILGKSRPTYRIPILPTKGAQTNMAMHLLTVISTGCRGPQELR